MNRSGQLVALLIAVVVISPALASQPGQPIDCADWVFHRAGLSCSEVGAYPCAGTEGYTVGQHCLPSQDVKAFDNTGGILSVRQVALPSCGGLGINRVEIVRYDGDGEQVLADVSSRCNGPGASTDQINAFDGAVVYGENGNALHVNNALLAFDPMSGSLWFTTEVFCYGYGPCSYPTTCPVVGCIPPLKVFKISGFTTTFEVLQTYTPSASQLNFGVPCMPEGLGGADHFDTYWGPLTKPIDFTQAHPLQCGYPATPPHVGDYETVADTLPTPFPDSGYYYVTATTYQGQTRYGRRTSGGKLSGRDPALLPACVNP